jgi:hypothetical protein
MQPTIIHANIRPPSFTQQHSKQNLSRTLRPLRTIPTFLPRCIHDVEIGRRLWLNLLSLEHTLLIYNGLDEQQRQSRRCRCRPLLMICTSFFVFLFTGQEKKKPSYIAYLINRSNITLSSLFHLLVRCW